MTAGNTIYSYKDLIVWEKAMALVVEIYTLANKFPKEEIYGLTSQMKRAAISIPSNIAEGRRRGTRKDYHQFFLIAYSSVAELETQIEIAKRLPFGKNLDYTKVDGLLNEIMRILNKMLSSLKI
ncbi:MAG: four helix bundle protein [Candidatus Stahlbacteria bacterium]|nr:four helix bundle protein [Candidatus Stahlbacteria bacterium]